MARCPNCNKFTGKNVEEDPEVTQDMAVDEDGNVSMQVRIANQCEECSLEIEEFTFDLESKIDRGEHKGEEHELEIGEPEVTRTDSGGGRYKKRMFGVEVTAQITCSCPEKTTWTVDEMKDEIPSSSMEPV